MATIPNAADGEKTTLTGEESISINDKVDNPSAPDKFVKLKNVLSLSSFITPEYFGAVGDGVSDDGAALQLWANYISNTANPPRGYTSPNKTYLTNQSITFTQFVQIESRGLIKAGLMFPANTPVLDFSLNTNTYSDVYARVDGANITGVIGQRFTNGGGGGIRIDVTALNCTTGIELRGNYEKTYSNCYVKGCDVGVHVYTFNTASPDELYIYIGGTACLTYFLTDGVDKTSGYVHLNIEGLGDNYVVQQRQGDWTFTGEIRAARGGVLVADDSLLTNFDGLHFIGESNVTEQVKVDTPLATVTGNLTIYKGGAGTDGIWIRQALNKGVNLTIDQISTSGATNAVRIGDSGAGISVDGAYIRGAFGGNTNAINLDFARFCDIDITNIVGGNIIVGSGSLRNTIRIPHRDRDNVITNNRVAKDNLFVFKGAYLESEMAEILSPIQGYRVESNIERQGTWDYNEDYSLFLPQGIPTKVIKVTIGDETTPLVVGATQFTFYLPWEIKLVDVRAEVAVIPTGNDIIVDINREGVSIFSTPLQIDRSTGTSVASTAPYVLSTLGMVDNSKMTVDIDQIGGAVDGAGLKVTLIGY